MEDRELLSLMDPDVQECIESVRGVHEAPFTRANDIEIVHIGKDEVRLRMHLKEEHMNGNNVAHGAAIYAIIDDTFAFHANLFEPTVGSNVMVSYHRPATGGTLESSSRKINESRSLSVFEIQVFCSGKLIATAMCTGFKTK